MRFRTRKKAGLGTNLVLILLGAAAFVSFYFCIELSVPKFDVTSIVLAVSTLIWSAAIVSIYLQSYAWYTFYELQNKGLYLRGVYSKGLFEFSSIAEIEIIEPDQAVEFMNQYQNEIAQKEVNADLKGWYQSNKRYSAVLRFSTVQFVHSTTTSGNERNIKNTRTYKAGRFVLIKLEKGQPYMLSPVDPERFATMLKDKTKIPVTI